MCEFGDAIRHQDFNLGDSHSHINHGSYGAVPKPVYEERLRMMGELERSPDKWYRWTSAQKWRENRQAVADFLGSDVKNVVLTHNATTGCNCVVNSLKFEPGESILVYNHTYKAVENACHSAMTKSGGELITVELPLKLNSDTIMRLYREKLEKHPKIKLVLLDLISSSSGIKFPIKDLIALCKEYGKLVLVDGAHGPGQLQIHLDTFGADFFTGNFHKWVYTPRGCAVLWVHPDFHHIIKPSITSSGYKSRTIEGQFVWQGTMDNTSVFCVKTAIQYYHSIGGLTKITEYCTVLLDQAVDMLTHAWGTDKLTISPDLEAPFLRVVALPHLKHHNADNEDVFCDLSSLMKLLFDKYKITTICLCIQGRNWIRLSANVYNTLSDYERLRDAILDIVKQEK